MEHPNLEALNVVFGEKFIPDVIDGGLFRQVADANFYFIISRLIVQASGHSTPIRPSIQKRQGTMPPPSNALNPRSLYRRLLRELPSRSGTIPFTRTPLHDRIRASFSSSEVPAKTTELQQMEQMIQYLRAQRTHTTLLERYNPGMNMVEEDRVRLTARRVGMDLPEELDPTRKDR
ncbi:MAG: hypothetical protein M1828_002247 [Chrysothrix sp. TS-e1954]|nr:MAG: hypothetical protein M1828_002247 [Chrysothrix sp. TS-e1954]